NTIAVPLGFHAGSEYDEATLALFGCRDLEREQPLVVEATASATRAILGTSVRIPVRAVIGTPTTPALRRCLFASRTPHRLVRLGETGLIARSTTSRCLTQRFARHSSPLTTTIYTHPSDEELYEGIRGLKS